MAGSGIKPLDTAAPRRGAAVLLEVLRSEGCRYIFGNPGTTELALMDALCGAPDIGYIWGLQEASVVAMADGYANASGRQGFVNLHTAGGLGHAMGAIINAQVSYTPLVITAGQQDMRHNLTDPLLFGDLVRIAAPVMKWATEIVNPDQIPVLIRRAFHDCTAAPSGPVFLSLPMNVMEEMSTVEISEASTIDRAAVAGSLDRRNIAFGCERRDGGLGRSLRRAGFRLLLAGAYSLSHRASALARQPADQSLRNSRGAGAV